MDVFDGIATKLDVRQFSPQDVPSEIKRDILEVARKIQQKITLSSTFA